MAGGPNLVLPFRGEQFSFSLNSKSSEAEAAQENAAPLADLAAVVFNRQGQFLDVVHAHKSSALLGALCSSREPSQWPEGCQAVPGDDVVHVMPKMLDPSAEVMVLVASVPQSAVLAQNLGSVPKLELVVTHATEENNTDLSNHVTKDLTATAASLVAEGKGQSMLLAVVFLDQPGWTVRFDNTGSTFPSWSLMLPELQAAISRVKSECAIPLDAAGALETSPPDETALLGFSRQFEDRSLDEATRFRLPDKESVQKLRLDVGWKFWKKGPEDEIEGAAVEFVVKFYNAAGEEVLSAGTNEREAQGVVVGRPEPEEGEAAEEEAAPEPEEEEAAEGGEEGEGGEGGEPAEPPPPPPEPAEDPYEFKERDVAFINLAELPKDVRCMVVIVSNYAGAGFLPLRHAGVKLWDVTGAEATETGRPLAEWHHISKFEQEAAITQVALLKVYKEYTDSAWNLWQAAGAKSIDEFVKRDPEELLALMKAAQDKLKEFKAAEAKALADAEESGEELTKELRASSWRYSVLGLAMGGESLDAAEHDIKNNVLNYDGPLKSLEARSSAAARVQFGGEKADTYFGGYVDDLKTGAGMYMFASGAVHIGNYKAGKREGPGVMLLPDGGQYIGDFAADRFHGTGQYRYPDGSVYTGAWEAGAKHGEGVYWDTNKGCLRGSWVKGTLQGKAAYDQPTINYTGQFVGGVPAGECNFTIAVHRTLDMHKFAASHILDTGPTLRGAGTYGIPPGSGDPPKLDEEGNPIEDPDKPPLPAFPKYEGLTFVSTNLPKSIADVSFPPPEGLPLPIKGVPTFSVATGIVEPVV